MAEVLFETQQISSFVNRTLAGIPCYGSTFSLESESMYPEVGKKYKVQWDGNEYICTAYQTTQEGLDLVCLGNEKAVTQAVLELVEPFFVFYYIGFNFAEVFCMTNETHSFGVYGVPEIVVLKDLNGNDVFYEGVTAVKLNLKDGGTVTLVKDSGNSEPVAIDYENTYIVNVGDHSYSYLTAIKSITLPEATSLGNEVFYCCENLEKADLPSVTSIGTKCFMFCSKLEAVILRSNTVVNIADDSSLVWLFYGCPIEDYGTGYIYVPASLVSAYQIAAGWSRWKNNIRAIEDYPDVCG